MEVQELLHVLPCNFLGRKEFQDEFKVNDLLKFKIWASIASSEQLGTETTI